MKKLIITLFLLMNIFTLVNANEEHFVKKGENLWDITEKYLKDPYMWVELWKINPQVRDPHWIYPGQKIKLPFKTGKKEEPMTLTEVEEQPEVRELTIWTSSPKTVDVPSQRPQKIFKYVIQANQINKMSYFSEKEMDKKIVILTPEDNRMMGFVGSKYFIEGGSIHGIEAETTYKIVRPFKKLRDVETGKEYGYLYSIVGLMKITEVYPQVSVGYVTQSYMEVLAGDMLIPFDQSDNAEIVVKRAKPFLEGKILDFQEGFKFIQNGNFVFIDKGKNDGLEKGDLLKIEQSLADSSETTKDLGRMVVIKTYDNISVAYVIEIKDVITAGVRFSTFTDYVEKK